MEESKPPCLLAVRLRGTVGDRPDVERTLEGLMLERPFRARLLYGTESVKGMLRKAKSLVAWGEPEPGVVGLLLRKRGERLGAGRIDEEFVRVQLGRKGFDELAASIVTRDTDLGELWRAGVKREFRLHPPKGGFKRSTRRAFTDGGELGYRGNEINGLVRRMI